MSSTVITIKNKINSNQAFNIVMFQKNNNQAIAYRVIQNLGTNMFQPIFFDPQLTLSIKDAWGNYTEPLNVEYGSELEFRQNDYSRELVQTNTSNTQQSIISTTNMLQQGTIQLILSRGKFPVASSRKLVPRQKGLLQMDDTIHLEIDTDKTIKEGDQLSEDFIKNSTYSCAIGILNDIEISLKMNRETGHLIFVENEVI